VADEPRTCGLMCFRYLNVATLLEDSPNLQSHIIRLQVCEDRKSVAPLAGVSGLLQKNRERTDDFVEVPLVVLRWGYRKVWCWNEPVRHQRLPSGRMSILGDPRRQPIPSSSDSTRSVIDLPRSRTKTWLVNCSTGADAVFVTVSLSSCRYVPPGKFRALIVNTADGVRAVELRNVMSGISLLTKAKVVPVPNDQTDWTPHTQ
jgi:hypothetical protein